MRRAVVVGAAVVVVAGGGAAFAFAGDGEEPQAKAPVRTGTATVERQDIVDTESVDGTLTYSGEREVRTGASGTVTAAPDEGDAIARGRTLLKVDGRPVTLMYGSTPMYRTLQEGVEGADVRQLEKNLAALGYGGDLTVDGEFTAVTADAVREWQDDRGLAETGAVTPAQVVFLPGAVRVKTVKAPEGARTGAGQPVLTVSGTRRQVHVDLDAGKQQLARRGAPVTVELPGGRTVKGRISEIGTVAEKSGDQQDQSTTIDVEITLDRNARTGNLDQAPVSVTMESERRRNVLSVPLEALLALREGGFGVEVVEGAAKRIAPVTTGVFGGGRVEVGGGGLREGMKVGVPAE
ncbi:peptidoglycan-binding protein [Actinomadura namibiensis]|uniref:Peptidoglycan hydrolase-like protein with peptidoglycan-binding domain n=1 Tax=Actinomadura namibiensis TaxID=182080 RepID=A0A7W3LPZ0_ACTNM|nr:peptidoglycan-binding protein [Actinomadura namibiensis]MBA8952133.1 peptidoglycan hydrolase-like protein with peptidoglycan-binding domain [Actinomadura namibiensis]